MLFKKKSGHTHWVGCTQFTCFIGIYLILMDLPVFEVTKSCECETLST